MKGSGWDGIPTLDAHDAFVSPGWMREVTIIPANNRYSVAIRVTDNSPDGYFIAVRVVLMDVRNHDDAREHCGCVRP